MKILKNIPQLEDSVVITLINYQGSVPQSLGAKALVTAQGLIEGTVGGGKVEAKAIEWAQNLLLNKNTPICQTVDWNLTRDIGMTCGGVVQLLFEVHRPKAWSIVVFGAGHVAQVLVPLLTQLEAHITCIDSRQEWLDKIADQPNLIKKVVANPADLVPQLNSEDYFILMTQGHATDLPILAEILRQHKSPYVGVIGSKTKALSLKTHLQKLDFSKEVIESFYCPIGLALGDSTPIEISISVVAQLIQVRDQIKNNSVVNI